VYPVLPISIVKYNYSNAYHHVAHSPSAAAQSIIIVAGIAYITLHLTFGGTWCAFLKMAMDLSNEIPTCKEWDHTQLWSPTQPNMPTPIMLPAKVPIAQAMPVAVGIPTDTALSAGFTLVSFHLTLFSKAIK
jgi:hypothetical protein